MSSKVCVSVIIPIYNASQHLEQCLDSIVNQTLQDIEIICVDDGSTDHSLEILERYAMNDTRIQILTQENAGPGVARNHGLSIAQGKYIQFLDSDDYFELEMLEKMYRRAEECHAEITICKTQQFDTDTGASIDSEWMLKETILPKQNVFDINDVKDISFTSPMIWDKLFLHQFLQDIHAEFPALYAFEDLPVAYESLLKAKRITVLKERLIHYRVNQKESASKSFTKKNESPFESFEYIVNMVNALPNKDVFKKSFDNWAVEFLVYHVCNMPDEQIRRHYFDKVRTVWFPQLNLSNAMSYYSNKLLYLKYMLLRYAPYPIFNKILVSYKQGEYKDDKSA